MTGVVFVLHFHTAIVAGASGDGLASNIQPSRQLFTDGIGRRNTQRQRRIGDQELRRYSLRHRDAQTAVLQTTGYHQFYRSIANNGNINTLYVLFLNGESNRGYAMLAYRALG